MEWNHPNFQAGDDAYYSSWKKGCKLRVALDDYSTYGKFAFTPKAKAMQAEIGKQTKGSNTSLPCNSSSRPLTFSYSCVHPGEDCHELPEIIKGGHFINPKHICCLLGCPYAPRRAVEEALQHPEQYVSPFTICTKGDSLVEIDHIIQNDPFYSQLHFVPHSYPIKNLYYAFCDKPNLLLFGNSNIAGYPINHIIGCIAYLLADENELFGKRVRGSQTRLIERKLEKDQDLLIQIKEPNYLSVLTIQFGSKACLVGAKHPELTKKLIIRDPNDPLKFNLRRPTLEDYA